MKFFKKTKDEEPTAPGQVAIKKRSRVPGVMITQFVEELPEGMTTPDFTRKPIALTIQEGKCAFFKAIVSGNPTPSVHWTRNNGEVTEPGRYKMVSDPATPNEHYIEMPEVSTEQADTYKCFATNEYGKAVVTANLNVIEMGYKKSKAMKDARAAAVKPPEDFKNLLTKAVVESDKDDKKDGEIDPRFWDVLMSADKKDYEKICAEFGVTNFRWMLKTLNAKKVEREEEQAKYVENLSNLKHIEVKPGGGAEFEFEMSLKDPNVKIFLFKDGVMVPFSVETEEKHFLKKTGRKFTFGIKDLAGDDEGLYQVMVEGVLIFSTDFKVPMVDFLVKIQEVKATEREDAVFECVLSSPMSKIQWTGKNQPCEQGEKFDIEVSEDMLIHRLVVKDCAKLDGGIYSVCAGIKSCNAFLVVEADNDPATKGKKKVRKTTRAGGGEVDLAKIAAEQKAKLDKERDERMELAKQIKADMDAKAAAEPEPEPENKDEKEEPEPVEEKKEELGDEEIPVEEKNKEPGDEEIPVEGKNKEPGDEEIPVEEKKKRVRTGPLIPDTIIDPGVHFTSGLSDISVNMGNRGELECKLSSENCEGIWYKDGKEIETSDDIEMTHDGAFHRLILKNCKEEDSGKYRFEADGRKTESMLIVEDPPRVNPDDLAAFSKPVIIKVGQNATFKLSFMGRDPMKIYWYNEGEELVEDKHINIEKSLTHSRLLLSKCQRKATGEIKIKIKNECGTIEGISRLIVLDRPSPALGPVEIIEASSAVLDFKWRPPKDNGGSPVINYIMERQQLGRNSWMKLGQIPGEPKYRDTNVDHGRKYCYHIRAVTEQGISEMMETDDIQAGTRAYPGQPSSPKVISAFANCINLEWVPPSNTGGTNILGYHLEKRKKGSNLWGSINNVKEPIKGQGIAVKDVIEGLEYEFRVAAINISGAGEPSTPSEFVIARDPKKPPGQVIDLKVTDSTYTTLSLGWTKPIEEEGVQDEAKGYFVEIRPAANPEWDRCNNNPIIMTSYNILGLKSMAMYWVRVIATNDGGEGKPKGLDNYIIAMPPPVRPHFTDRKMMSFMVVRAGNSARININFEASPMPNITWLKDGMPVSKRVTISNSDNTSQLLIPTSERPDTGIYTIIVKNMVGQETFSIEIRVTDDPKPPGPAELEQNVPGTVTVTWTPSPDEKRDDRLHYIVSRRDSVKRMWQTVADHLFNNKFTALNIMAGREYYFRVYAKNDMGLSEPSESPTWGVNKKKDKFPMAFSSFKSLNFESAPSFLVPLKTHSTPESYECYMSCAVRGDPTPHVTWYRNNISLNTNTNYLITNTSGVCSMLILRVGPKDTGEYKVIADNALGRAECSTKLTVNE
ncbi:immunoglobulin-like and fibronectin type III domain-containing protein 1 isoform X1 [Salmo trutta]|uniref:immunoglobulin-like and fibronectin type III domain-containing protein 1 isoform X1 n=1 Tax=Salmo trutta TaxID=8032 RepID=UPI001130E63D|nr:immunoglobulin-like and fibronectin type III domain-containing protein 1 isoform X1 [Salmo trutta]XP_029630311.1 immunoglobulin-like and fibronectin type III domain-containing protein 1 isoform X1 [Salmo trutta]